MGFIFCGKHLLLVTRTQVSDPGPMGPLVLFCLNKHFMKLFLMGAQWLSGRVLVLSLGGRRFEPYWRHCVVSLSKNINSSLELVQTRKTDPALHN